MTKTGGGVVTGLKVDLSAPTRKSRPTYKAAISWLALNLPEDADLDGDVSIAFAADLFGHDVERVVRDVLKARASGG